MKYLILSGSGNDPKNDFTQFLKNNALWICLGIVGLILMAFGSFVTYKISNH